MTTSMIKYDKTNINLINTKIITDICMIILGVFAIAFTSICIYLTSLSSDGIGLYNLIFSTFCILLQVLFVGVVAYDIFYLKKVTNVIIKEGAYSIKLNKSTSIKNQKISKATIILMIFAIVLFILVILQFIFILVEKSFNKNIFQAILGLNCFMMSALSCISQFYTDSLLYSNYLRIKNNCENTENQILEEPASVRIIKQKPILSVNTSNSSDVGLFNQNTNPTLDTPVSNKKNISIKLTKSTSDDKAISNTINANRKKKYCQKRK